MPRKTKTIEEWQNDIDVRHPDGRYTLLYIYSVKRKLKNVKMGGIYCTAHKKIKNDINLLIFNDKGSACKECEHENRSKGKAKFNWTIERVDKILEGRGIKRMFNKCGRTRDKHLWKCLDCNGEWSSMLSNVCHKKSGCPICYGNLPYTMEIVDKRIKGKNIKRLFNKCKRSNDKHPFKCLKCDYEWSAVLESILNIRKGCPQCSGNSPYTMEKVFNSLKGRKIIPLFKECGRTKDKYLWKCLECDHEWKAILGNVCHSRTGCPGCYKPRGWSKSKYVKMYNNSSYKDKLPIVYFLRFSSTEEDFYVYGLTFTLKARMGVYLKGIKKTPYSFITIDKKQFPNDPGAAYDYEKAFGERVKKYTPQHIIPGIETELFLKFPKEYNSIKVA